MKRARPERELWTTSEAAYACGVGRKTFLDMVEREPALVAARRVQNGQVMWVRRRIQARCEALPTVALALPRARSAS